MTGDASNLVGRTHGNQEQTATPPAPWEAVKARPVELLRLGTKARYFHEAGLHTLGDLMADGVAGRLRTLPGVGPKTARLVPERLADIRDSAAENGGEADWDGVAASWGFGATPGSPVATSENFLASLPEVVEAVIDAHESPMDRLILAERISRTRAERMTLEAIGNAFNVTKQRAMQRQVRLLDNLADALINDDQSYVPMHFRESFREFWVRAARHFQNIAQLDYPEFERGLEEVWGLPAGELAPFMPLAVAILADGVKLPAPAPDLHPALATAPEGFLDRPLHDFPFGRAREGLEAAGLVTLGLLLDAARENRLPPGRDGRIAIDILNGVGRALADGPAGDADAWATGLGLLALPRNDPADGAAFLEALDDALADAARVNYTSGRAEQIYRLRTCIPRRRRPTLQDIAVALATYGPTVKREETVLLASLHTQLVAGDMTDAAVAWRPGFLSFFKVATEVYDFADGDYNSFCDSLGLLWKSDPAWVKETGEGLWAVLSLYPGGRRTRPVMDGSAARARVWEKAIQPPRVSGSIVVLRGFRRPH